MNELAIPTGQVLLPGIQTQRWEFDDPEPVSESDREKRFKAEMEYWKTLPVTPRMMANRAQVIAHTKPLPTKPENLLSGDTFCCIRDELAVTSYTERLPGLLERCDVLRVQIGDLRVQIAALRPKIQFLDYILTWPEINQRGLSNKRHELINQRRALEEAKLELEWKLQPIDAEYHLIEADMPIRLERLNIAQQVEAERHHALHGLNIAPGLHLYAEDFIGKHVGVLGMTGMGKSNLVAVLCEELAPHIQMSIIDLEGEYWSLRDKHPFLVVGRGAHVDRQIDVMDATRLVNEIMESGQSVILDMYEFDEDERNEFLRLYLNRLFEVEGYKKKPHIVVMEEAAEFLSQQKKSPVNESAVRLANRGRKRGISIIMASQRPAKLDKNVLNMSRMLFLLGVQFPQDIGAYRGALPKDFNTENVAKNLATGQAIVRRAGPDGKLLASVYTIRRRETTDLGATPTLTKQQAPEMA